MQYSTLLALAIATLSVAAPTPINKRAAVLGTSTYDDLSVSGGVAGDALNEVLAKLPIDTADFANVDPADIAFLGDVNDIANDAETEAFNVAIEAATGDEKIALQNGKIKNKVLKLEATVLELQAKAAQGEDTTAKLAAEQKKLDNNIALDAAAAGQPSTFLSFDATAGAGGATDVGGAAAGDDAVAEEDVATDEGAVNEDANANEEDAAATEKATAADAKAAKKAAKSEAKAAKAAAKEAAAAEDN